MKRNVVYSFLIFLTLFMSQQVNSVQFKIVTLKGSKSIKIGNSKFEENGYFSGDDTIFWNANHNQSLYVISDNWKGVISYDRFKQTHSARLNHHIAALNRVSLVNTKSGSSLGREYDFKLMLSTVEGFEQKRLALVIGNENYKDERDKLSVLLFGLCDSLRACGFDVLYLRDCNEEIIKKSFEYVNRELNKKANQYEAFVFYYEGHGLINKQKIDCLVPVEEHANQYNSKKVLPFKDLASLIKKDVPKFFVINACRDSKSLDGGVFSPECNNTCFFFSTTAGKMAKAGINGTNSKFTDCFASKIMKNDIPFDKIMSQIQDTMATIEQSPVSYGCLPIHNRFVFHPTMIDFGRVNYILGVANNLYLNAKSKLGENNKSDAKALCFQAQDSIKSIKKIIDQNNVDIANANYKLLSDSLNVLLSKCEKIDVSEHKDKIKGLIKIAEAAEAQGDMGTALRNYYGAQLKMRTMPQNMRDDILYEHISNRLNSISQGVIVKYEKDAYDETQAKLYFYWPDGRSATNVPFRIDNVDDEGQTTSSVDGSAYITMPIGTSVENLSVSVNVDDASSWGDAEMRRLVSKNPSGLQIKCKPAALGKNPASMTSSLSSMVTSIASNNKVANSKYFDDVIVKVCNGISTQDEESIKQYFTENGYKLLQKLLAKKHISVKDASHYELLSYYGEIYVRSIKMSLHFQKGKTINEDVVFVFNKDKKIDGLQYAIDEASASQIKNMELSDSLKYAVLNLIENYRTAYSLQNQEYIEKVFSDDAVIIVGRVIKESKLQDARMNNFEQKVDYLRLSKDEYLKRLERQFKSKEWIDIKFENPTIQYANKQGNVGIGLWQEYSSSNYCDKGYLFLIVGWENNQPIIYLRAWHPQQKFGFKEYEELLREVNTRNK